jgi:hypothetical protein
LAGDKVRGQGVRGYDQKHIEEQAGISVPEIKDIGNIRQ